MLTQGFGEDVRELLRSVSVDARERDRDNKKGRGRGTGKPQARTEQPTHPSSSTSRAAAADGAEAVEGGASVDASMRRQVHLVMATATLTKPVKALLEDMRGVCVGVWVCVCVCVCVCLLGD